MHAEIISIGSEITSGQNLDTNSQWLSRQLAELGISVAFHTTVADELNSNIEAFRIATSRCGIVLATGGLGPTQDDLTREILAKVAGVELILDGPSLQHVEEMFAKRGRTMPERNRVQAMLPAGSEAIPNERGTAPGIWMQIGNAWVAAMPGVPSEMYWMFEQYVKPRLKSLGLVGGVLIQRKINCFGVGESAIEERLLDLTRRDHVPEVGITVSDAVISLRILARSVTVDAARAQIAPVERIIRERLGELVFGEESDDLEHSVARLLHEKQRSIATAESITAGQVAERLARIPGISDWLRGGIVAYQNEIKTKLLGVPADLLAEHGAVSAPVAEAMAIGCRERFQADIGVSTTGLAGPGGEGDKPIGLVFVGLAHSQGVQTLKFNWGGTRTEIQGRTARLALNLLRLHLLKS